MSADIDVLDPPSRELELESGLKVNLVPLRTRQLFRLFRIITRGGALGSLLGLSLNSELPEEEFMPQFLGVILVSIPEAEQETIDFLQSMVEPVGLRRTSLTKQDKQHNETLWAQVLTELDNPDPLDLVTLIEAMIRVEGKDIQALGKRIKAAWKLAEKTGQLNPDSPSGIPLPSQEVSTLEDSEESSI